MNADDRCGTQLENMALARTTFLQRRIDSARIVPVSWLNVLAGAALVARAGGCI